MKKLFVVSVLAASMGYGGAYKIPEQSLDGMALGAAHIAHTTGADSAYYNPANMAFLDPDLHYLEGGLTGVYLPQVDFDGVQLLPGVGAVPATASSEHEWALAPFFHYVHTAQGPWRWGVSVVAPAGLTRRWDSPVQKLFAQHFELLTMEINPSLSYRLSDNLAFAAGVRMIYSDGIVRSDGNAVGLPVRSEMKGDTIEWGYNLALAWRPAPSWEVGITYRSRVDLKEEGSANLYLGGVGRHYNASVKIPVPAALNMAVAKTFDERLTVELVYERTYWSAYKELDFEYEGTVPPALRPIYDDPHLKDWHDTNTFRIGVSYRWNDRLTLMAGYAYDETPVPVKTLSYELPDSDAHIFSAGFRYRQTDRLEWGIGLLYDHKTKRTIAPGENLNGIIGSVEKGGALLGTVGFSYKF